MYHDTITGQPFLRRINGKGELLPDTAEGYWTWARYVSGTFVFRAIYCSIDIPACLSDAHNPPIHPP